VLLAMWTTGVAYAQTPVPLAGAPESTQPASATRDTWPAWLRLRAEVRERMESGAGIGYTDGRDDTFWLTRFRLQAAFAPARVVSFQVQIQDARVAAKDVGPGAAPFSAPADVRVAFAEVGTSTTPVALRAGRQELAFGEQRLVGHLNWANAGRSFDGARLTLRSRGFGVDLFAASVVRTLADEWDRSGHGSRFAGAYASTPSLVPRATVEPYAFWRAERDMPAETGGSGDMEQATTGVRWNGAFARGFDYDIETAIQRGSVGLDRISAWAWHSRVQTPTFGPRLRLVFEYNHASGDDDSKDGTRETFDQLYPTGHDKYGLSDQVGWRNVHHVRAGVDIARFAVPVSASWHTWWVASESDAIYAASGAPIARLPEGIHARHVGHEIDVQTTHTIARALQITGGYAYLHPGAFLRAATPGASYNSVFLTATYVWLGGR
jgi:hypothetical protein